MALCNPFAGKFQQAEEPSNPLAKLAPSSLDQLASLLYLQAPDEESRTQQPNSQSRPGSQGPSKLPTEEWCTHQLNSISRLPSELRCQLTLQSFLRLRDGNRPNLCHAHLGLNERLIWWCYDMLKQECSNRFIRIRRWHSRYDKGCNDRVAVALGATMAAEQYIKSMEVGFSIPHSIPISEPNPTPEPNPIPKLNSIPKLKRSCHACFLSLVGANTQLLVGLRANMLSRTRAKPPRLLRLIDAWIAAFETDLAASLRQESHSLSHKLTVIRAIMKKRRDEKIAEESPERSVERAKRERGRAGRTSHGSGPPPGSNGSSRHDTPRPPRTPSANTFADPNDADTLFHRLSADAAVSAGVNPEVMSTTRQDTEGYTPSEMAQGYDGKGNFCHGYGMKRGRSRGDQAAGREGASTKSTSRRRNHDQGSQEAFENASAVPDPLRPRSQEASRRDVHRTESSASRNTSRHHKTAAGTAAGRPSAPHTSSRRYSVDSYVPPRRSWKAQAPGSSMPTNPRGGRTEYRPHPFGDAAYDVSDLESDMDADVDDDLYSSEVETEFHARTVVPDAPPSRQEQQQQQQSREAFGSSTARSQFRDDVASSVYSANPGQAPSSIGPRGGDASRWKRSRTASHRRPGASSSTLHHRRTAASTTASASGGHHQPRRPDPAEYADIPAEMRARFGMHSSRDQSIAPGDSISAVGERLASRRRRESEPGAAATREKRQQTTTTTRPSWWKAWAHGRRKAAPPPPPPRETTKARNQRTERGGGGGEAHGSEGRWRRMSDAETEWENLYRL